jgi:hypothetical protein
LIGLLASFAPAPSFPFFGVLAVVAAVLDQSRLASNLTNLSDQTGGVSEAAFVKFISFGLGQAEPLVDPCQLVICGCKFATTSERRAFFGPLYRRTLQSLRSPAFTERRMRQCRNWTRKVPSGGDYCKRFYTEPTSKCFLHTDGSLPISTGEISKFPKDRTSCSDVGMMLRQTSDLARPLIRRYNKLKDRQALSPC